VAYLLPLLLSSLQRITVRGPNPFAHVALTKFRL